MKTTRVNFLKIIVCTILIANCTNNNTLEAESLFAEMYKSCEMNKLLAISFVGKLYTEDRNVNFSVVPTSNISVIFPSDFNIKILSFDIEQGKWLEIKNNVQYFPEDAKYIIGKNDPIKEDDYSLINVIPILDKKADLRMVMYGHVYENGIETDICTGAYMDFEFMP